MHRLSVAQNSSGRIGEAQQAKIMVRAEPAVGMVLSYPGTTRSSCRHREVAQIWLRPVVWGRSKHRSCCVVFRRQVIDVGRSLGRSGESSL
mmetsp:Transcript_11653/g.31272  ORF Transcript_11653/g.31272 Transcript_11653/m.31272 type:complete len:91 (-) Transcript_11653:1366-1638(-)